MWFKKFWLVTAFLLVLTAMTAAAGETGDDTYILNASGFSFEKTEKMKTCSGTFGYNDYGSLSDYVGGRGIVLGEFIYQGLSEEEVDEIRDAQQNGVGLKENRIAQIQAACRTLFLVFGLDEDRGEEELKTAINELFGEGTIRPVNVRELGHAGRFNFFFVQDDISGDLEELQAGMGERYQEFLQLYGDVDAMVNNLTIFNPMPLPKLVVGQKAEFEATDLDGNPVTSQELFSKNKVTMVNLWTTWCHFCVEEMPELEKLSHELAEKGCGIVGICLDSTDEELTEKAKGILRDAGVTYPNVAHFEGDEQLLPPGGYPTTYFLDSEGRALTEPVYGANLEAYRTNLEEALRIVEEGALEELTEAAGAGTENLTEAESQADLTGAGGEATEDGEAGEDISESDASSALQAYVAKVVDQNGDPVPGAILLMCNDDTCMTCECDENGIWVQTGEPCAYHVQILTVPEGYSFDETFEYVTAEAYEEFTVEVVKD